MADANAHTIDDAPLPKGKGKAKAEKPAPKPAPKSGPKKTKIGKLTITTR